MENVVFYLTKVLFLKSKQIKIQQKSTFHSSINFKEVEIHSLSLKFIRLITVND